MAEDDKLVEQILQGDLASYEILVKKYQTKIFQMIVRMTNCQEDAFDLTQETFLQAYRQLNQFKNQASFYTWLYRIAVNKTLDFLRKRRRLNEKTEKLIHESQQLTTLAPNNNNPEQEYLRKEKQKYLQALISTLPEKYRIPIILHHYQELSYQEIADILELPIKTVSTRIYRARSILKEKLTQGREEHAMP